jgi:hypothetical protein
MKRTANPRYFILLQVVIMPLFISFFNVILIGAAYWQNGYTFGIATGITLAISICNFALNGAVVTRLRGSHPEPDQYIAKTVRQYIITALISCSLFSLSYFIYQWIHLPGFEADAVRLGLGVLLTLIVDAVVTVSYENIYNFGYWQQSRQEVDTLSKAQLQAQLDALRQQVNPHFLFNSLNSLISLIDENPKLAVTYAEELSSVYRYLLRSNETPLVPLASELAFLDSYYHLLRTRHGDSLMVVTRLLPGTEELKLPPLTLQLLLENAVKHNIILPEYPLTIALSTKDGQRKPSRALSNGVGLSNILSKYAILGQPAPTIEDDGREFRVTLPLVC